MRDLMRAEQTLRRLKGATATLLGGRAAFTHHPGSRRMFLRAMREAFAHHFLHDKLFRERCRVEGLVRLRAEEDLARIPRFEGAPDDLDGISIRRMRKIFRHIFAALGLTDRRRSRRLPPEPDRMLRRAEELCREQGRRFYWRPEHGIPYVSCERGELHVPRYASVQVAPEGGLLFFTPWQHSFPALAVLGQDRGEILEQCACGRRSAIFRLL